MSYEHFWKLDETMTREVFRRVVRDFKVVLPHLEVRKGLIQDSGTTRFIRDHSVMNDNVIMFNAEAEGEALWFQRLGSYSLQHSCKTNNLPYDVAVNCVLLIAKRYLKHGIHINTDGETKDWRKALLLCQYALGDEYFYMHITQKNSMVRYRWWDMEKSKTDNTTEYYGDNGLTLEDTGGGCTVFHKSLKSGWMWVSSHENENAPDTLAESVMLGVYDEDGELVTSAIFDSTKRMFGSTLYRFLANNSVGDI